ncbi:MAG: RodZ domain-containing protein [Arenicellales bacterium]
MAEPDSISKTSPGAILRAARELQGWNIEEVAAELNLLPDLVEALERDDYSLTAGWTYAVGYLRNYARLVGVSVDRAIVDRKELLPPQEDGPGTLTEALKNRRQPVPIHYRWVVTAAVLLFVFGGLYAAYLNRSTDVERARIDVVEETRSPLGVADSSSEAAASAPAPAAPLAVTLESPALVASTSATSRDAAVEGPSENASSTGDDSAQSAPAGAESSSVETALTEEATTSDSVSPSTTSEALAAAPVTALPENSSESTKVAKSEKSATQTAQTTGSLAVAPVRASAPSSPGETNQNVSSSSNSSPEVTAPQFATAFANSIGSESGSVSRPVSPDSRELVIKVKENTHIVVWDKDEQVLLRRYVESGKVVSLSGLPPFTLAVSYPEGSSIIYGGREMAIPVPRTGLNAKIRVGQ